MQKKNLLRIVSGALSVAILAGSVYCEEMWNEPPVWAWTSSELQSQKEANDAEIAEMQSQLEDLGTEQASEEEYQETLTEKLELQQENVAIVDEQLTRIEEDIAETQEEIAETEVEITEMEADIEVGLEEFKSRIRAMYISGNTSLASVLVGAEDFFDFLSKYNLISRVAKHDNDLINELNGQLEECNQEKTHLEEEKAELDTQLEEQTEKMDELEAAILELQADYETSVEHAAMLEERQALLNEDIDALEAANKELEEEDARILEAILEAEAEAERKRQESIAASQAAAAKTTTAPKPIYQPTTTTVTKSTSGGGQAVQTTQAPVYTQAVKTTQAPVYTTTKAVTTTTQTQAVSTGRFAWPCPGFYVLTSGFGPRWGRHHSGIDISSGGISGASVVSSLSGTVTKVNTGCSHNYAKSSSCGCGGGYGNYVLVQHSNGYSTMYAHMSSVAVYAGQSVYQGQTLGYVGSTGFSTGPHLHYEVRLNGTRVDPELYLY